MIAFIFNSEISIGNVLSIATILTVTLGAYFSLRESSRTNKNMLHDLRDRLDRVKLEEIKERVHIMWLFQLRRGLAETEMKGLGQSDSPLTLTEEAMNTIKPMVPELKAFYEKIGGDKVGLIELAIELETEFGTRIVKTICNKIQVSDAACLVIAIAQLRPIGLAIIDEEEQRVRLEVLDHKRLRDLSPKREVKAGWLSWMK